MFASGIQQRNTATIQVAAVLTMLGVILNRINYTFIAYNWTVPLDEKYWPSTMEIVISACYVLTAVWIFRWVVNRMPVLSGPAQWAKKYDKD
jgi:hypothetical protein